MTPWISAERARGPPGGPSRARSRSGRRRASARPGWRTWVCSVLGMAAEGYGLRWRRLYVRTSPGYPAARFQRTKEHSMHPVAFDSAYEVERNRLTTFFRFIVAIPWIIWIYLYGIAASIAAIIAWFALLFTKRYPESLYGFVSGYVRIATQIGGFITARDRRVAAVHRLRPTTRSRSRSRRSRSSTAAPRPSSSSFSSIPQQILHVRSRHRRSAARRSSPGGGSSFTGKQSVTMHDAIRVAPRLLGPHARLHAAADRGPPAPARSAAAGDSRRTPRPCRARASRRSPQATSAGA